MLVKYQCEERIYPSAVRHIHFTNVSQEILDATFDGLGANNPSGSDVTVPITISSISNRDTAGLHARGIFVAWESDPPPGYKMKGRVWIPVLLAVRWNRCMIGNGGQYRGERFIIVGKRPEVVRV